MTNRNLTITTTCPFCGKENYVEVDFDDFMNWTENNVLIQDAFPYLSADERELIKTGICSKCWDDMFGNEGEEEYNSPILSDDWEEAEEEDDWHDWEDWDDDQLELGFDPYLGCYSDDC